MKRKDDKIIFVILLIICLIVTGCIFIDGAISFFIDELERSLQLFTIFSFAVIPITISFSVYKYFDQKKESSQKTYDKKMFELAINSHFSKTIINKRIEFVEKYVEKFQEIGQHMLANADTRNEELFTLIYDIKKIKNEYVVWLSNKQMQEINKFERDIVGFAADSRYLTYLNSTSKPLTLNQEKERQKLLNTVHESLTRLFADDYNSEFYNEIKSIFGVEIISKLHQDMFASAHNFSKQ